MSSRGLMHLARGPRKTGRIPAARLRAGQEFRTLLTRRPGVALDPPKKLSVVTLIESLDGSGKWREFTMDARIMVEAY